MEMDWQVRELRMFWQCDEKKFFLNRVWYERNMIDYYLDFIYRVREQDEKSEKRGGDFKNENYNSK